MWGFSSRGTHSGPQLRSWPAAPASKGDWAGTGGWCPGLPTGPRYPGSASPTGAIVGRARGESTPPSRAELAEASTRPPSQEQQMPDGDEAAVLAESEESLPEPLISRRARAACRLHRVKDKGAAFAGSERGPHASGRRKDRDRAGAVRPSPLDLSGWTCPWLAEAAAGRRGGGERLAEGPGLQATATRDVCTGREGGRLKTSRVAARQPGGGLRRCEQGGRVCGGTGTRTSGSPPRRCWGSSQAHGRRFWVGGRTQESLGRRPASQQVSPAVSGEAGKGPRAGVRPRLPQPEHSARTVGTDGPPPAPACGPASPRHPGES